MAKREREEEFIALGDPSDRKTKKQKKSKDDKPYRPQLSLLEFKKARKEKKMLKQAAKRERREKPRRQGPKNLEKYGSTKEQKAARKLAKKEAEELRLARLAAKAANGQAPNGGADAVADALKRQKEAAAAAAAAVAADSKRRRDEDKAAKKARKEARRAKKREEEQGAAVEEDEATEIGFVVDLEGDANIAEQAEADSAGQEEVKKLSKAERKALKRAAKSKPAVNDEAVDPASDRAVQEVVAEDKMEIEPQLAVSEKKAKKEKSKKDKVVQEIDADDKMEVEPQLDVPDKQAKKEKTKRAAEETTQIESQPDVSVKKAKKEKSKKDKTNGDVSTEPTADELASDVSSGYTEHAELSALPESDITTFLELKQITVNNAGKARRPITSFKYLPITEEQRVPFKGFTSPTPIQAAAWPYLLDGRDVIGVAETGSGKTLAFGVPCIRRLSALDKASRKHIRACIVSPTRELALQIQEQLAKFTAPFGLKVTCVYGGVDKDAQRRELKGTQIVVATPGRLNDFIGDGSIDLSHVDYMVLDEADRMLDKGFEEEVRKIVSSTAETGRQTLMFTATWPPSVRDLAGTFMTNPVRINIGDNTTGELRANTRIVQEVEVMDPREKQDRLIQLLKQYQSGKNKNDKILVFCLYKKEATRIEEFIRRKGFNVAGIHGDLNQQKRTESLEAFKQGHVPLLVATDVAARGLDIPAVKLVINVTFPLTAEDYVHRIGRTGRAGQDGKAITFFTDEEKGLAGALINVLKAANQSVPEALLKYGTTVKKKSHDVYGAFYKDTSDMKASTKITFD